MKTRTFFFINKDAGSDRLTQSDSSQSAAIQRYVQRDRPRPRKKKLRFQKQEALSESTLCNPTIRTTSCKLDPFNSSSVPIDDTIRGLFHYYVHYYHPSVWTYGPSNCSTGPYVFRNSVVKIINTAVEDSLTLYCLVSAAASRIQHVDGLPFQDAISKEPYFMQQALRLMQERIDSTGPETMIAEDMLTCVRLLGAADGYRGDFAAARLHLQAALKIMEPMGGVMRVNDKDLQGQILMSDLALACLTLEPCVFECSYDPGPACVLGLTEVEAPRLTQANGLGMTLLLRKAEILPRNLKNAVEQILESYAVHRCLRTESMSSERAFETTHWVTKRNMAIRRRLLALEHTNNKTHALRTALIMWTLLAMNITGRVKTVKVMAAKLVAILASIATHEWNGDDDIELWILLVGCSCAKENSNTQDWFVNHILALCIQKQDLLGSVAEGIDMVTSLTWFQRGFLYHEPVQGGCTEKLADILSRSETIFDQLCLPYT